MYFFSLFLLLPLSPFFSLLPPLFDFIFVGLLFHSSMSFLIIISSSLALSHPPVPSSSSSIHLSCHHQISFSEYLQFKCHQSCFSPCCLWSTFQFTLMTGFKPGASCKSWMTVTVIPKRACSVWQQSVVPALCVIVWRLHGPHSITCITGGKPKYLLNFDSFCYHYDSSF